LRCHRWNDGSAAVYALLSIWICVIISLVTSPDKGRETLAAAEKECLLLLDPGHGGLDGGAVSVTGTAESRINYDIAERCLYLGRFCGLRTAMTRDSYEIEYPPEARSIAARKKWDTRNRASIANETPDAVLMSIHQNYYPSANPHGAQVLYASNEPSRVLAENLQTAFSAMLPSDNRRRAVPADRDIYLMSHVRCPAVLVECGFLSNPEEAARLESAHYQKKLSLVMIGVFCREQEHCT